MVVIFMGVAVFVISRVPDQNGVSLLYIMLEIPHSGWEPSKFCLMSFAHHHNHCLWPLLVHRPPTRAL